MANIPGEFKCPECDRVFKFALGLGRHLSTIHKKKSKTIEKKESKKNKKEILKKFRKNTIKIKQRRKKTIKSAKKRIKALDAANGHTVDELISSINTNLDALKEIVKSHQTENKILKRDKEQMAKEMQRFTNFAASVAKENVISKLI